MEMAVKIGKKLMTGVELNVGLPFAGYYGNEVIKIKLVSYRTKL